MAPFRELYSAENLYFQCVYIATLTVDRGDAKSSIFSRVSAEQGQRLARRALVQRSADAVLISVRSINYSGSAFHSAK